MNKKGAVFHWVVAFGILAALAVFLSLNRASFAPDQIKGDWSVDFLKENYFPAEMDKLDTTIIAKEVGIQTAFELGKKGGFFASSDCGQHQGKNLWNKQGRLCFTDIYQDFQQQALRQFQLQNINITFVNYTGTQFFGKGEQKTIETSVGKYTYQDQFIIDIKYSFDQYQVLLDKSQELISLCRDQQDLANCLQLPDNWKIGDCQQPELITSRLVSFCVLAEGELSIEHHFALDFTPVQQVSTI